MPSLFKTIGKAMTSAGEEAATGAQPDPRLQLIEVLQHMERRLAQVESAIGSLLIANVVKTLDFELPQIPRYADPKRLHGKAGQVCSQNGEDGMIAEVFRRIGVKDRTFVEIGVGDGHENNSAFLLAQGWHGWWLDGDPRFAHTLEARADLREKVVPYVGYLTRDNVAQAFAAMSVPVEFDFLSVDVDQNTYHIWEALAAYRPRAVVVEYNASIPPDVAWAVRYDEKATWDGSNNFGASLKAYELLGRRMGYSLVGCDFIGVNAFFVRDDLAPGHFAEPFTAENHYEPPRYHFSYRRGHRRRILDVQDPPMPQA